MCHAVVCIEVDCCQIHYIYSSRKGITDYLDGGCLRYFLGALLHIRDVWVCMYVHNKILLLLQVRLMYVFQIWD